MESPDPECGIPAGPVALRAFVDVRGHGAVAPREIRWASNLQGDLGAGYDLVAELVEASTR